jgi:hypothetical protein
MQAYGLGVCLKHYYGHHMRKKVYLILDTEFERRHDTGHQVGHGPRPKALFQAFCAEKQYP